MNYPNLAAVLSHQADRLGQRTALRRKRHGLFMDLSWSDYADQARCCAAALIDAGVQPGDRVGLASENRVEWLLADMGLLAAGAVNVPAHASQSAKQIEEQCAHAEVSFLFASNAEQYAKVRGLAAVVPGLKGIVCFEPQPDAASWQGFLARGRRRLHDLRDELARRQRLVSRDDLATIMYTSGTTGNSKGVMLTHGNLLSNAESMAEAVRLGPNTVVLSWLPFSHIYGRLVDHYMCLVSGHVMALAESQETLLDDLQAVQPTCFAAVPRFYEKVLAACASPDPEATKRKLRHVFGPRIERMNSGGAPLPPHVAEAFEAAGLIILQGYGLTESSPVISFNRQGENRIGTVGPPVPGVEVKIAPDGEVLSRGPHIMKGYWKNPAATADAIRDGWLYTGDLGTLDAQQYLTITGRKKDLLVLSNGKKVVPTHVEGLLLADPCIEQVLVHGEGKNFLTALIVPAYDRVRAQLGNPALAAATNETLAAHPSVQAFLAKRIDQALADLAHYEQVRKFLLLPQPFSVAADEMTVSLKLRRGFIFEKYRKQLEAMYA
jgi:long-chain acyl-CoA synthetase